MDELQDALARDGDFKFLVSEELTKTEVYQIFMEKYTKDAEIGEETAATFHLKQGSNIIEDKGVNVGHVADISDREMEIGNVSPEVEDKYFPIETLEEKENESVKTPEEMENIEK